MNLRSTIFTATIATLLSHSVSSAADVPIQVRNKTDKAIKLSVSITESTVSREKDYSYTIPAGGAGTLASNDRDLQASKITYSFSVPSGMRAPGDPFLQYVMEDNGSGSILIDIQRKIDEVRYPTAVESRQYREYLRIQSDFHIDVMRMINQAWDF